jgi:predicted metal-dependent phosphotriesterase family hydrolase
MGRSRGHRIAAEPDRHILKMVSHHHRFMENHMTRIKKYAGSARLSRREALNLLGLGGLALISTTHGHSSVLAAPLQAGARPRAVTFPQNSVIRTLLKDIPPQTLTSGATLFHEHFSIALPPATPPAPNAPPPLPNPTKDLDLMVEEAKAALKDGIGCIVDGGHADMGTDYEFLKQVTLRSGLPIVASGGYYMERVYPPDLATKNEDQIAEELARQATANRFGAFGEIGENPDAPMSPLERKVFRAIGKAHVRTNLPIFTHNAYGTGPNVPANAGLVQLDVLESAGVRPQRIAVGHTCCLDDPKADIIKQIAKRGAFVGFDRVTGGRVPDDKKVIMVLAFLDAGYADQLLLCSDFTGRRSAARPGYGNTVTVFAPMLRKAGVKEETVHAILYDNPRRFLAFVPKAV